MSEVFEHILRLLACLQLVETFEKKLLIAIK